MVPACACARYAPGALGWRVWVGDTSSTALSLDVRRAGGPALAVFRGFASVPGRRAATLSLSDCGSYLIALSLHTGRAAVWDAMRGGLPLRLASPGWARSVAVDAPRIRMVEASARDGGSDGLLQLQLFPGVELSS